MMRCRVLSLLTALAAVLSPLLLTAAPSQYHAQLYTEILGRSPKPAEWAANEALFDSKSPNVAGIKSLITALFQSAEFNNLGYQSPEKAYVLFRAVLLREPSSADIQSFATQLDQGVPISTLASNIANSPEFSLTFDQMVRPARSHAYRETGPSDRPRIGSGGLGNISGDELQQKLNAATPGSTVFLSRGALIRLHRQLVIPSGVTLATFEASAPDKILRSRQAYSAMGRLVRARLFNPEMVRLMPGARLMGVWVDGRRSQFRVNDPLLRNPAIPFIERFGPSQNITVRGGENGAQVTEVAFCKITDSTGWTNIHGVAYDGSSAAQGYSRIANNLITCYSASKDLEQTFFTDGISNATSDAIILNNDIVDPTDVGVVLFNPGMHQPQRSQVINNNILFAANSGWGGITLDHSIGIGALCRGVNPEAPHDCFDASNPAVVSNFEQSLIQNNVIWSSDDTNCNVGISLGVHMWGLRMFGKGGQVIGNQLGNAQQPLQTGVGIMVSGNFDPIVLQNTLNLKLDQSLVSCISAKLLLDPVRTTLGSGSALQPGFSLGETWDTLRPRSNGFLAGAVQFASAGNFNQGLAFAPANAAVQIHDFAQANVSKEWVIIASGRTFEDGYQHYVIMNRGNHAALEVVDGQVRATPYTGAESQYWRFESFDSSEPGNGLRLVHRSSGLVLSRSAVGAAVASAEAAAASSNWLLQRFETRPMDLTREALLFVDPFGDLFQILIDRSKLFEYRFAGNPNADFGFRFFASDNTPAKPLGMLDLNRDGRQDLALLLPNGSLFVAIFGANGYTSGVNLGSVREKWGWDIHRGLNSWEKPLGFVDLDGNGIEDLVVVDLEGNLEVGFIEANTLGGSAKIGAARDIGLTGANGFVNSTFKCIGSGDLDGNGKKELVFVGIGGGIFRVDAGERRLNGSLGLGNPLAQFGWGMTSAADSPYKPVGMADIDGDGDDDIVMIDGDGNLFSYVISGGRPVAGANLGNPRKSWSWDFSANSSFTRPVAIGYGKQWWGW
jgi:hypothetical protein